MMRTKRADNSNVAVPIPLAAPLPAKPMKWPLPILEANKLAPIGIKCIERLARKYPSTEPLFWQDDFKIRIST
jgi:hypothetical protein